MKFTKFLASTALVFSLGAPVALSATASAVFIPYVECSSQIDQKIICDLSVDKQVSVNGGAFVDADTASAAATAHVGDTVTWKITVTNTGNAEPRGTVYVADILPTGVTYGSSSASAGSYITDDTSIFDNNWYLPLLSGGEFPETNLPATLTITTTANSVGLVQNTAALAKYDNGTYDGGAVYNDSNDTNDSNDAFVNVVAQPQVLGSSTTKPAVLAETGINAVSPAILITLFIASSAALVAVRK